MTLKQAVHALLMLEGAGIQASISHHGAAKRDYNIEMVDCNGTVDIAKTLHEVGSLTAIGAVAAQRELDKSIPLDASRPGTTG